jgi:hypothetical protein
MPTTVTHDAATLAIAVHTDHAVEPGVIALLLDLLRSAGVRATWIVPDDADRALLDRLAFESHAVVTTSPADTGAPRVGPSLADAPRAWLDGVHVSIGRAMGAQAETDLVVEAAGLSRGEGVAAVAEALDLVAGLVRAGRLRVTEPEPLRFGDDPSEGT